MKTNIHPTLTIDLSKRSYPIFIGEQFLQNDALWQNCSQSGIFKGDTAFIITNITVAPLYRELLEKSLRHHFSRIWHLDLPDGEIYKNWDVLNTIFDALLNKHANRKTTLFALGGGVIGDMTGFAAAIYMRGIPFIQIPTTLLAQVDSSVGGKTAINHTSGKNMIGAFYQPLAVISDITTLQTLPKREYISGLAEVIKYGPIADLAFFSWLENNMDSLLVLEPKSLEYAITRSCQIKADIVNQDETESNIRAILNFGHTFAHAIETGSHYQGWLHGEAVGCGMIIATRLSALLGTINNTYMERIIELIKKAGLPTKAPDWPFEKYKSLMQVDKKNESNAIRFVIIHADGHAKIQTVPDDLVAKAIAQSIK